MDGKVKRSIYQGCLACLRCLIMCSLMFGIVSCVSTDKGPIGPYAKMVQSLRNEIGMPRDTKIILNDEGGTGGTSCFGDIYSVVITSNQPFDQIIEFYEAFIHNHSTKPWTKFSEPGMIVWSYQTKTQETYLRVGTKIERRYLGNDTAIINKARKEYPTVYELAIHSGSCLTY